MHLPSIVPDSNNVCRGDKVASTLHWDETTAATATGTPKNNKFIEQNNNFALASRFLVHFFTTPAQLWREMAKFK